MQITFAIGFVVFRPSAEFLIRLKLLGELGCKVYVYDNSPEQSETRTFAKNVEFIIYLTGGKNLGLGIGISAICAQAYYDSYSALLFFDQDTSFDKKTIYFVQEFFDTKFNEIRNDYSAIVFNAKASAGEPKTDRCAITTVTLAISSGSLYVLENLKHIGWHNENYFVDCVDYEMCLRSVAHNLKIGECRNAPGFDHVSEQPDTTREVFGRRLALRRYSTDRIMDTSVATGKLVLSALLSGQLRFAFTIVRSFAIYVAARIVARIL